MSARHDREQASDAGFALRMHRGDEPARLVPGGTCRNGHTLTPDNIYVTTRAGRIRCRACDLERHADKR